jgi:hypothetical protein
LERGEGLRLPASSDNTEGVAEDSHGEAEGCCNGDPGMAFQTLVESDATASAESNQLGGGVRGSDSGPYLGSESGENAARELPYGEAVIKAVTDERHRPGMAFVVEVFRIGKVKESFLVWWFNKFSESARRKRLHGWRMWQDYCVPNNFSLSDMSELHNPAMVVADFVSSLEVVDTQIYLIKEAVTAVKSLLEVADPRSSSLLRDSQILEDALRASNTAVKGVSKYRTIWKLEKLLEYMRKGPPHEQLSWTRLMARAAALFMIFIPCRPVGAWRMKPSTEKWASDGESVEVQAREKLDRGKGVTVLLLRKGPVENLCPVRVYLALRKEAAKKGLVDTLWGSEKGVPYKQASAISRWLKVLLLEAGIPSN